MARKSGINASEAFELFLDTASNAFGGVIFIALLVCVLLQLSGVAGKVAGDPDEARRLAREREELQAEVARLQAVREAQLQQLAAMGAKGDGTRAARYAELAQREEPQRREHERKAAEERVLARRLAELAAQMAPLRAGLDESAPQLAEAERAVTTAQQGGAASGDVVRPTRKQQVPLLLAEGRLRAVYRYDAQGRPAARNEAMVEVREAGAGAAKRNHCFPRPGQGTPVEDTREFTGQLQDLLRPFTGERHSVAVAVWPDSFAQFEVLRRRLAELKFGYYLLIMRPEEGVPVLPDAKIRETGGGAS